jgi:predicted ferric reductase
MTLIRRLIPQTAIARAAVLGLLLLSALWLWAEPGWAGFANYFGFRALYMQYSGVLALGAMSACMLLAVRPRAVERTLGGLDKMYRLHKWLGITALVTAVAHWWLGQGTKWMVGWGWIERRPRGPRPPPVDQGVVEAFLGQWRRLAEDVGEWAFYAAALLMVLALVKRFPYRWFAKTHQLLAVGYLALAAHSVVLTKFSYWSTPLGVVMALMLAGGSGAAVWVLLGRVGARRRVGATVQSGEHFAAIDTLSTELQLDTGWRGHAAGQFAFVTVDRREGAHPYTMASAWDPATRRVRFVTKALGDHTRELPRLLLPGTRVTVEGPYGCFDFEDGRERQVWVGAGIGITPFIARLEQLARRAPDQRPAQVDLIHPTAVEEPAALARLQAAARAAGVRLHVLVDARDGRLDTPRLQALVPDWARASVWFCGPAAFGQALWRGLSAAGLARRDFHQELFEMR